MTAGAEDPPWLVNVTDEADEDLRRLRRARRTWKVWQEAVRLSTELEADPFALGDSCEPPLEGVRRVHFWNDKYRLVWLVIEDERRVDVLAVGLKDPTFYDRVLIRFDDLRQRVAEEAERRVRRHRS